MNKHLTEIAFVLDRSGSMQSCREQAIAGFNQFLDEQLAAPGEARLTLVLFDNKYTPVTASVPLPEVCKLDMETFVPRGGTALLDAIGRTIDELGTRLRETPEANRPGAVIVAILTDGEENSSHQFNWQQVSEKIAHQTNVYRWQFLFLGAGQDAIATASQLSIPSHNASQYTADGIGTFRSTAAMGRKLRALRKLAAGAPLDAADIACVAAPLSELVKEEDEAGRKPM
jgi:uncharacterized protein YegL